MPTKCRRSPNEGDPPLFAVSGFGSIWASGTTAYLGRVIFQISLSWIAFELSGSPAIVGSALAALALPQLALGLLVGGLSDRPNRRVLVIWGNMASAGICILAAVASVRGLSLAIVILLALLLGSVDAFRRPGSQALAYAAAGVRRGVEAMIAMNLGWDVATIAGGWICGVFLARGSAESVFVISGVAFLLSSIFLIRPSADSGGGSGRNVKAAPRRALLASIRLIQRSASVRTVASLVILAEVLGQSTAALLPSFSQNVYHAGPEGLGAMFAFRSLGAFLGLLILLFVRPKGSVATLLGSAVIFGLGLFAFALAPSFTSALGALIIIGAGAAFCDAISQALLQEHSEGEHGAGMGIWVFSVGSGPVGLVMVGAAAAVLGPVPIQIVCGGALAAVSAAIWFTTYRQRANTLRME